MQIQTFKNHVLGSVRVALVNGEPLFCASDVCASLQYVNGRDTIIRLFGNGVAKYYTEQEGGGRTLTYITESQLYKFIMRSEAKNAEPFQDWVCNEVLPSIRKNGGYILNQENLSETELLAKAVLVAQNVIANKDKVIAEQKEVIEYQESKLHGYKEIEKSKRNKEQLATSINKNIRLLAEQKFNRDYGKAYNHIYSIFASKHLINEKISMSYLRKNNDYLAECLEIVLSELD